MAKNEAKEIELTDKQISFVTQYNNENNQEKSFVYEKAVAVANKINDEKQKITTADLDTILNFWENDNFSLDEKNSLNLSEEALVSKTIDLKNPEYAAKIVSQDKLYIHKTDKLTKLIEKDEDAAFDCAIYDYNMSGDFWGINVAVSPLVKDFLSKKPSEESYSRLAEFIFETETEDKVNDSINWYASQIFGSDRKIEQKSEKQQKAIKEKKQQFVEKMQKAVEEQKDARELAEIEAEEDKELVNDASFHKAVEQLTNQKFQEKFAKDINKASKFMAMIEKGHPDPKERDAYLNKLRSSRTYKKAYAKYSKMYETAKNELRIEAKTETKQKIRDLSKSDTITKKEEMTM